MSVIQIGDAGRQINLESIKLALLGNKTTLVQYSDKLGLDEGEREELSDLLSGEIEICDSCGTWKESHEIQDNIGEMTRVCGHCVEGLYI